MFLIDCKQDPIYVFPDMKLRGLVPNFHIHVPRFVLLFCCSKKGGPIVGIYKSLTDTVHECRNWERGRAVSFLGIFVLNFRCRAE
jgi:hypothetical protein